MWNSGKARSVFGRASLTRSMVLTVGIALGIMQAATTTYDAFQERSAIVAGAERRATAALDMLEAVHVQAMLNRKQTADGDAAIATLDGAMEQFSQASHGVELWLVMGPKVLAYQTAHGEEEMEGPHDAIDVETISTARPKIVNTDDRVLRVTRPVILGQGFAAHDLCAACHTAIMGIGAGEIIGAYSAAVDLNAEFVQWRSDRTRQATAIVGVTAVTLLLIWGVLQFLAFRPLRRLAAVTRDLVNGRTDVVVEDASRRDEVGLMARALEVFRTNMIISRRLEGEKAGALHSLQLSEMRFRDIAEAASDWLWETDAALRLTYLSDRFCTLTGRIAADTIGQLQQDVLTPIDDHGHAAHLATLLRDRHPFRGLRCTYTDAAGDARICDLAGRPLTDENGAFSGYRGTATDVTAEIRAHAQARHLALHDSLTGLPNRVLFADRLEQVAASHRLDGEVAAVLCLDLDHFKTVNDTLGHPAGDALLREVAARMRENLRETDIAARLGGDEFAIIQLGPLTPAAAEDLCRRLVARLAERFRIDDQDVFISASIGAALVPRDGRDAAQILKSADIALYHAKAAGRGTFRFFAPGMDAELQARRSLEMDLRQALALGQLEMHYQPLVETKEGRITGVEALMRWHHPVRGMVSPAQFIPIAEATELILPLGEWALRTACAQVRAWGELSVSVNLSPVQFRHPDLVALVRTVLRETGLDPARLELEITEGVLLQDADAAVRTLNDLKALGLQVAMDDFGTGYSSLSYLHRFAFDKLKIDQSFVRSLGDDVNAASIIRAILSMSRSLGLRTTAEGVETEAQLKFLREEGCDQVQGYYLGRPATAASITESLATHVGA